MAGVKQFIIAHIETGKTTPTLETMMKILVPLGKTLAIMNVHQEAKQTKTTATATDFSC